MAQSARSQQSPAAPIQAQNRDYLPHLSVLIDTKVVKDGAEVKYQERIGRVEAVTFHAKRRIGFRVANKTLDQLQEMSKQICCDITRVEGEGESAFDVYISVSLLAHFLQWWETGVVSAQRPSTREDCLELECRGGHLTYASLRIFLHEQQKLHDEKLPSTPAAKSTKENLTLSQHNAEDEDEDGDQAAPIEAEQAERKLPSDVNARTPSKSQHIVNLKRTGVNHTKSTPQKSASASKKGAEHNSEGRTKSTNKTGKSEAQKNKKRGRSDSSPIGARESANKENRYIPNDNDSQKTPDRHHDSSSAKRRKVMINGSDDGSAAESDCMSVDTPPATPPPSTSRNVTMRDHSEVRNGKKRSDSEVRNGKKQSRNRLDDSPCDLSTDDDNGGDNGRFATPPRTPTWACVSPRDTPTPSSTRSSSSVSSSFSSFSLSSLSSSSSSSAERRISYAEDGLETEYTDVEDIDESKQEVNEQYRVPYAERLNPKWDSMDPTKTYTPPGLSARYDAVPASPKKGSQQDSCRSSESSNPKPSMHQTVIPEGFDKRSLEFEKRIQLTRGGQPFGAMQLFGERSSIARLRKWKRKYSCVKYPIVIASRGRAETAHLNLSDPRALGARPHLVVVVIEPHEVEQYRKRQQQQHVLAVLPKRDEGIGYARLCIQLLADALQWDFYFMMDDNLCGFREVKEHGGLDECTFIKPLAAAASLDLEKIAMVGFSSLRKAKKVGAKGWALWNSFVHKVVLINHQLTFKRGIEYDPKDRIKKEDVNFVGRLMAKADDGDEVGTLKLRAFVWIAKRSATGGCQDHPRTFKNAFETALQEFVRTNSAAARHGGNHSSRPAPPSPKQPKVTKKQRQQDEDNLKLSQLREFSQNIFSRISEELRHSQGSLQQFLKTQGQYAGRCVNRLNDVRKALGKPRHREDFQMLDRLAQLVTEFLDKKELLPTVWQDIAFPFFKEYYPRMMLPGLQNGATKMNPEWFEKKQIKNPMEYFRVYVTVRDKSKKLLNTDKDEMPNEATVTGLSSPIV